MTDNTSASSPVSDQGEPTREEEIESLAKAIHQGDWTMVAEWRWERATRDAQRIGYLRAEAVLAAYESGTRDQDDFAAIIESIEWNVKTGGAGRLRAKAAKVVQWFNFRERGYLLD